MAVDGESFQKYPIYSGVPQGSIPRNKNTIQKQKTQMNKENEI